MEVLPSCSSKNSLQSSSRSSHEKSSFESESYLILLGRQRTADHADILVKKKKAVERTKRKFELLQNSFECEREKILEEFEETTYNIEFVNLEKKQPAKRERYRHMIIKINHYILTSETK